MESTQACANDRNRDNGSYVSKPWFFWTVGLLIGWLGWMSISHISLMVWAAKVDASSFTAHDAIVLQDAMSSRAETIKWLTAGTATNTARIVSIDTQLVEIAKAVTRIETLLEKQ